jgi:hypothetical protein
MSTTKQETRRAAKPQQDSPWPQVRNTNCPDEDDQRNFTARKSSSFCFDCGHAQQDEQRRTDEHCHFDFPNKGGFVVLFRVKR